MVELVDLPNTAPQPPVATTTASAYLHGRKILRGDSAAYAVMDYGGNEFPSNIGAHLAFNFKSAHLFVERIEELLTGCSTSKGGASFLRTAKSAQVKQALRGSIEHYAHAVKHLNDAGSCVAHFFNRHLVS